MADLVADLGDIPLHRIRLQPPPGCATIADVDANKCCELIDGTLVEKATGLKKSILGAFLIHMIGQFVFERDLGFVAGADGTWRLKANLVRLPDVAFVSWKNLPDGKIPEDPVPFLSPDLAIEVLSAGNTKAEMTRKRGEYFKAGVQHVWMVDRFAQTVTVYASENDSRVFNATDIVDGGSVLPGFALNVRELFDAAEK